MAICSVGPQVPLNNIRVLPFDAVLLVCSWVFSLRHADSSSYHHHHQIPDGADTMI